MENVKQITDKLMERLERDGFSGQQLRDQVESGLVLNLPVFHATCSIVYEEERMDFRLTFREQRDGDLPYRFTELHAVHREAVDIETEDINGVNIADLDKAMAAINWHRYFSSKARETAQYSPAEPILESLRVLSAGSYARGKFFQQCLMLKHWPAAIFQKYREVDGINLQGKHEHRYTFRLDKGDHLNAHLAFHIMSERYDSLRDMVEVMGLDKIAASYPVYDMLTVNLKTNPDAFQLTGHFNLPEGYAEFSVPVEKINGWYSIQEFELTFTPYPSIKHDNINGINTAELEAEMRKVDWSNDQSLFHFHEDREPEFKGRVYDIQEQLYRVSQDIAGAEVADLLRLKYLADVTFFGDNIEQRAWDRLEELPKLTRRFPADQDITSGARLLAGRAVFASTGPEHTENERHWMRLDLTDAENGYPEKFVEGFSRQELEDALRPVSTSTTQCSRAAAELMEGKLARINSPAGKLVLIEAAPEKRDILFYSEDLRPIPVNLRMDPDWHPEIGHKPGLAHNTKQPLKKRITGRQKGKGL